MSNIITRMLADERENGQLGFDGFGQLWAYTGRTGTIVPDLRGTICRICNRGWNLTASDFLNYTYLGDVEARVHKDCYERFLGIVEHRMWINVIVESKLYVNSIKLIPNEYGGGWNTPWYLCELKDYPGATLKLGMRRRVYNVSVTVPSAAAGKELMLVFKDWPYTKGSSAEYTTAGAISNFTFYCHTYSERNNIEVFAMIRSVLNMHKADFPPVLSEVAK